MNDETSMEINVSQESENNKDAVSVPKEYPKQHPKQHPSLVSMIAICVAVSIGASLATIVGYDRWFAQKVVAVDIKGYIAQ